MKITPCPRRWQRLLGGMLLIGMLTVVGCTPESPPLVDTEESHMTSAVSSDTAQITPVSSDTAEQPTILPAVWDGSQGKLLEISFRYDDGGDEPVYYRTDNKEQLAALTDALQHLTVSGEREAQEAEQGIILLYTAANDSGRLTFVRDTWVRDGKQYTLTGYEAVKRVLSDIQAQYPVWRQQYEEWIHRVSAVDDRLKELTGDSTYEAAPLETKRQQVLSLLERLTAEGLVREGSVHDGGDSISFTYDCDENGVSGAVMLTDFDPLLN